MAGSLNTDGTIAFQKNDAAIKRAIGPTGMRLTDEHFIHDDPQRPPVAQLVVSRLHEDLRSDVVRRAHRGIGLRGVRIHGERRDTAGGTTSRRRKTVSFIQKTGLQLQKRLKRLESPSIKRLVRIRADEHSFPSSFPSFGRKHQSLTSCLRFFFQVSAFLLEFMFWNAVRCMKVGRPITHQEPILHANIHNPGLVSEV